MVSPGDVLAKAAERNWLYEGEHFLKVNSILQYNLVIVVHPNLLGSHLSLLTILRIIHLWSTKTPVGKMLDEVEV